jgi:hypothetical protein
MKSNISIRRGSAIATVLANVVIASALAAAQTTKRSETFKGTTVNMSPGAGKTLTVDVIRWSTDAEMEKLAAAFTEKGEQRWSEALQAAPTVGYIWIGGESIGYSVRYAQRITLPDGGDRVIVATDRPLGSWDRVPWKAIGPSALEYPFAVVDLRLPRNGQGEGKASLAAKVAVDHEGKTIALENDAMAPVLIKDVKRERSYE